MSVGSFGEVSFHAHIDIGVDLGGQPGHVPPIIEKRPCIHHFLPPIAPPILWFAHPIFLTSLRGYASGLMNNGSGIIIIVRINQQLTCVL